MSSKSLGNTPIELIFQVLSYLDINDLLTCSALSRHFRTIICNSSQIQYTIELEKHRLVSVLPPWQHPSCAYRLQILREREYAWSHGRWKGRHRMRLPFTGSVYDFVSGIYGNGGEDIDGTTKSISFVKLPSANEPFTDDQLPESRLWTHSMSDLLIFDFTMDPSQDLLVLLVLAPPSSKYIYELHLRTLSTNEPHPEALCPRIPCISGSHQNMQLSDLNPVVTIQVIGDLVAVLFKELIVDLGALLSIWSWKLGPKYSCTMHRISGIDDFTFLDESTFLLVRPAERLEVYKFVAPANRSSVPECIVSLELPPLSSQYRYWYITLSTNPTPGYTPRFPSSPFVEADHRDNPKVVSPSSEQLNYPKPHERVLACCLYIFDITQPQDNNVHSFVFFANIKTFLKPAEYWLSIMPDHYFRSPLNQGIYRHLLDADRGGLTLSNDTPAYGQDQVFHAQLPHSNATPDNAENHNQDINIPSTSALRSSLNGPGTAAMYLGSDPNLQAEAADSLSDISSSIPSLSSAPTPPPYGSLLFSNPSSTGSRRRQWRLPPGSFPSIPWEVWGPQSTRWFTGNWRTDWQHATYGLRTADSVRIKDKDPSKSKSHVNGTEMKLDILPQEELELDEETGNSTDDAISNGGQNALRLLRVRDYNPHSVALASEQLRNILNSNEGRSSTSLRKQRIQGEKGRADFDNSRTRVVTEPSITPTHGVYKDDIKSWLPYVETLNEEKLDITDVMLDDRRLLLLKRDNRGLLVSVDVLMM